MTLPRARIVHRRGIQIHRYAGDTRISYDVTDMKQRQDVIVQLDNCINDLQF